ncbi:MULTISPECIES: phage tail protein [unclassified Tatumella]|uniref:phage tail assembly protein T n=1 Tax=unclassified Tatumella TaxID=2649542 RepID=UPI001BAED173|nr:MULTISPECIES: phage tail protein [unclassified Tatumella]MBS0878591.1 phage tail protein [Tatumella sp. JGM82]MBS0892088.1 phage tail protein [Tatumella sp. JGM94]MBS0900867.1 phage tail protein [Tatumella sp. JGM100]
MNGIGGRTIAEAQERISISEYYKWLNYRNRTGGLNPVMRTEWGAALISSVLANVNKSAATQPYMIEDFAPNLSARQKGKGISLDQAKKEWI